jgi:hypothetical protein
MAHPVAASVCRAGKVRTRTRYATRQRSGASDDLGSYLRKIRVPVFDSIDDALMFENGAFAVRSVAGGRPTVELQQGIERIAKQVD